MAKAKLRAVLDRHLGKDPKIEKQKKLQKDAEKKKRRAQPSDQEPTDVDLLRQNIAKLVELNGGEDDEDDDESWGTDVEESEDDGEDFMTFDAEQLNESDSDSDDEDDEQPRSIPNIGSLAAHLDEQADDEDEEEEEDVPLSELSEDGLDDQDIVPHQRLTINNTSALHKAFSSIALPTKSMLFTEHQSLTTSEPVSIPDVDDDLNRELAFYAQSLAAVKEARTLLKKESIPFARPTDYFAEMVKSDEHMGKIKAKLIDDAANKKASADARRQRDLKRFGKQVQQEKLKERAMAKKDMLEKVKVLKRKRQGEGLDTTKEADMFDVALEDAATTAQKDRVDRKSRTSTGASKAKRQKKDEKYGFGGKKRFAKSGDAISSADMSAYSIKKMKGQSRGGQRPGKSKRAKQR